MRRQQIKQLAVLQEQEQRFHAFIHGFMSNSFVNSPKVDPGADCRTAMEALGCN